jgi:hypothetical protein
MARHWHSKTSSCAHVPIAAEPARQIIRAPLSRTAAISARLFAMFASLLTISHPERRHLWNPDVILHVGGLEGTRTRTYAAYNGSPSERANSSNRRASSTVQARRFCLRAGDSFTSAATFLETNS